MELRPQQTAKVEAFYGETARHLVERDYRVMKGRVIMVTFSRRINQGIHRTRKAMAIHPKVGVIHPKDTPIDPKDKDMYGKG